MQTEQFNRIVEKQLQLSKDVLVSKASEYATEDRLHNFKVAAELQGVSLRKALSGMMAKHTVSVYDLCADEEVNSNVTLWEEKITDHINYLLLLRAVLEEELSTLTVGETPYLEKRIDINSITPRDEHYEPARY